MPTAFHYLNPIKSYVYFEFSSWGEVAGLRALVNYLESQSDRI